MQESEPDWATVLRILHEENIGRDFTPEEHGEYDGLVEFLSDKGGMEPDTVRESLDYLDDVDLINISEYIGNDVWDYNGLTNEGFKIAHERKLREEQVQSNRLTVALTLLLAAATMAQAMASIRTLEGDMSRFYPTVILLVGLLIVYWFFGGDLWEYIRK